MSGVYLLHCHILSALSKFQENTWESLLKVTLTRERTLHCLRPQFRCLGAALGIDICQCWGVCLFSHLPKVDRNQLCWWVKDVVVDDCFIEMTVVNFLWSASLWVVKQDLLLFVTFFWCLVWADLDQRVNLELVWLYCSAKHLFLFIFPTALLDYWASTDVSRAQVSCWKIPFRVCCEFLLRYKCCFECLQGGCGYFLIASF